MFYISGWGKAIPANAVTNDDLSKYLDTNDEWITSRTGIKERRIIDDSKGENALSLAFEAAEAAIEKSGVKNEDIDCIIVATASATQPIPSMASIVSNKLGIAAPAFDLNAACSGFVYALNVAAGFFEMKLFKNVLAIGVDTLSAVVDKNDRSTAILFGDGAGAVVLSAQDDPKYGMLAADLGGDASQYEILEVPAKRSFDSCHPEQGRMGQDDKSDEDVKEIIEHLHPFLVMNGKEVFKVAVRAVEKSIAKTLEKAGITGGQIDHLLLHQANVRIIDAITERLDIDREKAYVNLDKYGNTSAASVPILLAEVADKNSFKDGDLLAFCGFGAGMTWGTCILRWKN